MVRRLHRGLRLLPLVLTIQPQPGTAAGAAGRAATSSDPALVAAVLPQLPTGLLGLLVNRVVEIN